MARDFDGVNDNIQTADGAVPGIDSATVTYFLRANVDAISGGADMFCEPSSTAVKSGFRKQLIFRDPVTSGFRLEIEQRNDGGGTNGIWVSDDITLDVFHTLAITYDRSTFATNDPIFYVDGVVSTTNESQTPVGTAITGEDSLVWGSRWDGTLAADCVLADCMVWNVILTPDEVAAIARGADPRRTRPLNIVAHAPILGLSSPEPDWGSAHTTYAITGTTFVNHPPRTLYTPKWAATVPLIEVAVAAGGWGMGLAGIRNTAVIS